MVCPSQIHLNDTKKLFQLFNKLCTEIKSAIDGTIYFFLPKKSMQYRCGQYVYERTVDS